MFVLIFSCHFGFIDGVVLTFAEIYGKTVLALTAGVA